MKHKTQVIVIICKISIKEFQKAYVFIRSDVSSK